MFKPVVAAVAVLSLAGCAALFQRAEEVPPPPREADGTVKTRSGLAYVVQSPGTPGRIAKAGDVVTVHYTGWLENGTKFDSSRDRGQPFTFRLGEGQVIQGWDEGVAGMKVGEKRKLVIPASLGYGERGAGSDIPPNATLIFDVEVVGIR